MGTLIAAVKTPWGEANNHQELVLNMDALLKRYGIVNVDQRVRMIAHAIMASGWKQKIWHFNAWGVKKGSWKGDYYIMGTQEADDAGDLYSVPKAEWRAFTSWAQAIDDFLTRISPTSEREGYRQASAHLVMEGPEHDGQYWDALGAGGYYTDKKFKGEQFASIAKRVRTELAAATPEQVSSAHAFAAANIDAGASRGWWGLALFAVIGGAIYWQLTRKG
jgi:hypothetical protein